MSIELSCRKTVESTFPIPFGLLCGVPREHSACLAWNIPEASVNLTFCSHHTWWCRLGRPVEFYSTIGIRRYQLWFAPGRLPEHGRSGVLLRSVIPFSVGRTWFSFKFQDSGFSILPPVLRIHLSGFAKVPHGAGIDTGF